MNSVRSSALRVVAGVVLLLCAVLVASAQTPPRDLPINPDPQQSRAIRDFERLAEQARSRKAGPALKVQEEFYQRLEEFASAWNALIKLCERGVWDSKQAQQTHKAFERLVKSQGWVEHSRHE